MKMRATLFACTLLTVAASEGCQRKLYTAGIGGNLVPVKQEPDGKWLFVPYDQVKKYRQSEKAKPDARDAAR
jgi:hypothetical protein